MPEFRPVRQHSGKDPSNNIQGKMFTRVLKPIFFYLARVAGSDNGHLDPSVLSFVIIWTLDCPGSRREREDGLEKRSDVLCADCPACDGLNQKCFLAD